MLTDEAIITHTKNWITDVVVGCNFCPFAAREVKKQTIRYEVVQQANTKNSLEALVDAFHVLDSDDTTETMFVILADGFNDFNKYLNLVELAETLLEKEGYKGVYQIAGFHPQYLFAGSQPNDAANYTNRSPYAMLHLLREASVSRAVDGHPDIDSIPQRNIAYAQEKGVEQMKALRDNCMKE